MKHVCIKMTQKDGSGISRQAKDVVYCGADCMNIAMNNVVSEIDFLLPG